MDAYLSFEDDDNGDGSNKEIGSYPINIPSI